LVKTLSDKNVFFKSVCRKIKKPPFEAACKLYDSIGGAEGGRTPDLRIANAALCQTELLPHMHAFDDKNETSNCQAEDAILLLFLDSQ
jgi:hypothetical protein